MYLFYLILCDIIAYATHSSLELKLLISMFNNYSKCLKQKNTLNKMK